MLNKADRGPDWGKNVIGAMVDIYPTIRQYAIEPVKARSGKFSRKTPPPTQLVTETLSITEHISLHDILLWISPAPMNTLSQLREHIESQAEVPLIDSGTRLKGVEADRCPG